MRFLVAICICLLTVVGQIRYPPVSIRPDRLREGDGKTRNITLDADVIPGASLNISVSYSSDPSVSSTTFIPKITVQDNMGDDKDSREGKISLVLPRKFDKMGVYVIEVDEPRATFRVLHQPNTSSYIQRFVDWLVGAAGSGERGGLPRKSARQRIEEITESKTQDKFAIWTAPMPPVGQDIKDESRSLKIRSALMPSWSTSGSQMACSAWRNGKWNIAAYTINRTGAATPLWQWKPRGDRIGDRIGDFSPAWSPNGDAIAFVRLTGDQKSDLWILQLDRNRRPKKEIKVTDLGNVQALYGWDKDAGLLFETKRSVEGRQVWAIKTVSDGTFGQPTPLSDEYSKVRGSAPVRQTVIYPVEKATRPRSALNEMDSSGKRWPLLIGDICLYQWPAVSHDEKWLAFDFGCPP